MEKIITNKNDKNNFMIYWNKLISHTKGIYKSNYWIYKLIIVITTLSLIIGASFGIREIILNSENQTLELIPNFLKLYITGNTGIAFSNLNNSSVSFIFFIQIFPVIVLSIILIFTKSIVIDIGLSMAIAGGLSNIIDRSIYDNYKYLSSLIESKYAVVDYLNFSFIPNSAVFNLPDVFVIIGIITIAIYIIFYYIKLFNIERKNKKEENINGRKEN